MGFGRKLPRNADVWNFVMVCSEILTGKVPLAIERRSSLSWRIIEDGIRPHLPTYLHFYITTCWQLQPARRPSFSDLVGC